MRNRFELQLEELNTQLIKMGADCETAISMAVKALLNNDTKLVEGVKETEREIDHMERSIEGLCMKLILGDQAADIANLIKYCEIDRAGVQCRNDIAHMAEAAIKMVTASVDAFVKQDIEGARSVILADDEVDGLFIKIKGDIINMIAENAGLGETVFDIVMIAKYLERIGDHATNIAEWGAFSITGEHENF